MTGLALLAVTPWDSGVRHHPAGADQAHPAGAYRAGLPSLPSTRIASRSCQLPSHACTSRTQSSGLRLDGPRGPSGGHARTGRAASPGQPTHAVRAAVRGCRGVTSGSPSRSTAGDRRPGVMERPVLSGRPVYDREISTRHGVTSAAASGSRKRHRQSRARDSEHGSPSWSPSARLASRPWYALNRPRDSPSRTIPRRELGRDWLRC